jgi:hypothetical protein
MSRLNNYMSNGPFGISVDQALGSMAQANTAFSTFAWETAKQTGCLQDPRQRYPSWPPRFNYPQMQKNEATQVLGGCPSGMNTMQSAYAMDAQRILDEDPTAYDGASQYNVAQSGFPQSRQNSTSASALAGMSTDEAKRQATWFLNSRL